MWDSIERLWQKQREAISYILSGILTTFVNYLTFIIFRSMGIGLQSANALAWVFAVTLAYFINRNWVFKSNASEFYPMLKEVFSFYLSRLLSLGIEAPLLQLLVNGIKTDTVLYIIGRRLAVDELIAKIITNVVVVILNYIFSKFIVFKTINQKNNRVVEPVMQKRL